MSNIYTIIEILLVTCIDLTLQCIFFLHTRVYLENWIVFFSIMGVSRSSRCLFEIRILPKSTMESAQFQITDMLHSSAWKLTQKPSVWIFAFLISGCRAVPQWPSPVIRLSLNMGQHNEWNSGTFPMGFPGPPGNWQTETQSGAASAGSAGHWDM